MARGTHDALEDERNEHILIYVNGELFPRNEAKVSVFDSGYLVGDGVWEGIRLHDGVLVFLEEHLDRLYQGAKAIALDIGMTRKEFTARLYEVIGANQMQSGVHVRLMITRGVKKTPVARPAPGSRRPDHRDHRRVQTSQSGHQRDRHLPLHLHGTAWIA